MNFLEMRRLSFVAFLENVKALDLTPVELDISLLDSRPRVLDRTYSLTDPIVVQKRPPTAELYTVRDGNTRVQQAKELGKTTILAIIAPNPMPTIE